jgi:hypothetical protein
LPSRRAPVNRWRPRFPLTLLVVVLVAGSCGRSPTGPAAKRVSLTPFGDLVIYAAINSAALDRFHVVAVEAGTSTPAPNVKVRWQVIEGSVALAQAESTTDDDGLASVGVRAAPAGTYRVRASADNLVGSAPVFELRVIEGPAIESVQPATVAPGAEVVVTGSGFSPVASENAVYFSGIRGTITAATATTLRVTVPLCLPPRQVSVTVGLGSVFSPARAISTTGSAGDPLQLSPGQVRTLFGGEVGCARLPGTPTGAMYLLLPQNVAPTPAPPFGFELRALAPGAPAAGLHLTSLSQTVPFADAFEARLRGRERELGAGSLDGVTARVNVPVIRVQAVPAQGERRDFNVLNMQDTFDKITATARIVTARAVLWVDLEAESLLTDADLRYYGDLFDDPIYPTNTAVFGEPSDVDGNQRIFILFTPRVNALTPASESSFITGFFYGCDLLARNRCAGSNEAEVFYSMVPDPEGRWSGKRPAAAVRAAVPPILAHEFQHMINFARRGGSADVLWLSEALAHTAEELVGSALQARDPALARSFNTANLARAQRYLLSPSSSGLLALAGTGSVEMRGGVWLLLKHVRAHHGGEDLLRRLTASTRSGMANLTQETGQPWSRLATDFAVALWADGAPELAAPLDARYRFVDFNLRAALATISGGYTLRPTLLDWRDFAVAGSLASGSGAYFLMSVPSSATQLNFVLAGNRGAPFTTETGAALSILRVR